MLEQGFTGRYEMLALLGCSFLAMLTVAYLLKEMLANIGARLLLAMQKPFRVGDIIRADGATGKVKSIGLFRTLLVTSDDTTISIPNASLLTRSISKFRDQAIHRIDMLFGVRHTEDIEAAKDIIVELLSNDSRIHDTPAWKVSATDHTGSSVYLKVCLWVDVENYWTVLLETTERIKNQFYAEEILMTYP